MTTLGDHIRRDNLPGIDVEAAAQALDQGLTHVAPTNEGKAHLFEHLSLLASAVLGSGRTGPENGGANAHQRGAFFDSYLEVSRHAHGQLVPRESLDLLLHQAITLVAEMTVKRSCAFRMDRRRWDSPSAAHLEGV